MKAHCDELFSNAIVVFKKNTLFSECKRWTSADWYNGLLLHEY